MDIKDTKLADNTVHLQPMCHKGRTAKNNYYVQFIPEKNYVGYYEETGNKVTFLWRTVPKKFYRTIKKVHQHAHRRCTVGEYLQWNITNIL